MADSHSSGCRNCGAETKLFVESQKRAKYCSLRCSQRFLAKNRAPKPPRDPSVHWKEGRKAFTRNCVKCGKEYESYQPYSKVCGDACLRAIRSSAQSGRATFYDCQNCGKKTKKLSASRGKRYNKYCSRQCAGVMKRRPDGKMALQCLRQERAPVGRLFRAIAIVVRQMVNAAPKQLACAECGFTFLHNNRRMKYCDQCRMVRKRAATAASRKKGRATNRHIRDLRKHKERARKFGVAYEPIRATDVFEAASWHCQICGCETPKEQRGKFMPNAPELDHIIPMSRGGPHLRSNVQCACRRCNGIKSNTVPAQAIAA